MERVIHFVNKAIYLLACVAPFKRNLFDGGPDRLTTHKTGEVAFDKELYSPGISADQLFNAHCPVRSFRHVREMISSIYVLVALMRTSLTHVFLNLAHTSSLTINASRRSFARLSLSSAFLQSACTVFS
jgi:hypothetical protein